MVEKDWFDRHSKPVEESRLPKGTEARGRSHQDLPPSGRGREAIPPMIQKQPMVSLDASV